MHAIYFYKDKQGNQPVLDYMRELARRDNKDSRIKLNKLNDYIELLSQHGTRAGQPYIKHLDAEIWELRPLRDRILFVAWLEGPFIDPVHQGRKGQVWLDDIVELIGDDRDQVLLRFGILIVGSVKRQGFI